MSRLIYFELTKIWSRRSFIFAICVLVFINIFLLWYTSLPDDTKPPLSAYHKAEVELKNLSDSERTDYIEKLKKRIDGVSFVGEVLSERNMSNKMGDALADQAIKNNPGVFEAYYDTYQNGSYLKFTDSFTREKVLIDELYEENNKVKNYDKYLNDIREKEDTLGGISVFAKSDAASFSSRNIEKSVSDYGALTSQNIHWMPSKTITSSMESLWTDLFLLLSVFLVAGGLITEEKEKDLFPITRSTKYGIRESIKAKLAAMLISCQALTLLLFGGNFIFFGVTVGLGNIFAALQSVATYMESSVFLTIQEFIFISLLTKGLVLFGIGGILMALSILSKKVFLPYFIGICLWGTGFLLYRMIPAGSAFVTVKYLNLFGLLKTEKIFGSYLNFDVLGYPVSRMAVSLILMGLLVLAAGGASIAAFARGSSLQLKGTNFSWGVRYRLHGSLLRHEGYKTLISNRGALILLIFCVLIGYQGMSRDYKPSVSEQYYENLMMQLEGEMTPEKEALISSEQARYDKAFKKLDQIDNLVDSGKIDEAAGDTMKAKWYSETAFYPAFQRVIQQYQHICDKGGSFIYDTGYLYLFGTMDNGYLISFLLIIIGLILAFGNVISMEYQRGTWKLIAAAKRGWKGVYLSKFIGCSILTAAVVLLSFVTRAVRIAWVYPLQGMTFSVCNIPLYQSFMVNLPIWGFIALFLLTQMLVAICVMTVILAISRWRKSYVQTIFFGILILALPLILKLMGFDFAGR